MAEAELKRFYDLGFKTIQGLESEMGILAAGRQEIYGCTFGRDTLLTGDQLMNAYLRIRDPYLLELARKSFKGLVFLQGKEENIQSGEQPGKCIHEFRPQNHDHLTKHHSPPWYAYADNAMRNYDSVDATPLLLIELHRYFEISNDADFIASVESSVQLAIDWIFKYGDNNGDGFVDYLPWYLQPGRTYGGLSTQSWMDSTESVFHEDNTPVAFPLAPVEVQAYTWAALMRWSQYYCDRNPGRSIQLRARAQHLKRSFNEKFWTVDSAGKPFLAAGLDGAGKLLQYVRSSMGHCLWAAVTKEDGTSECIVENDKISAIVDRLMEPDMFVPQAGIRTLTSLSSHYEPNSYHNGSIWPHDTSIVAQGFENFSYFAQADMVRQSLLSAFSHFAAPIELFTYDQDFGEWCSPQGQRACREQAWSAAAMLLSALPQKLA